MGRGGRKEQIQNNFEKYYGPNTPSLMIADMGLSKGTKKLDEY